MADSPEVIEAREKTNDKEFYFEKTRDRNIKWKNRKHRVPLKEGRLWIRG